MQLNLQQPVPEYSIFPRGDSRQGKVYWLISEEACILNSSSDGKQGKQEAAARGHQGNGRMERKASKRWQYKGYLVPSSQTTQRAIKQQGMPLTVKAHSILKNFATNANEKKQSRNKIRDIQRFHLAYEMRLCLFRISSFMVFLKIDFIIVNNVYKCGSMFGVSVWILVPEELKLQVVEVPDICGGTWTPVFCKSSTHS